MSLILGACGTSKRYAEVGVQTESFRGEREIESGVASWYGPNFHGKMTANGEIYNMYSMTAAHRTLPFDTFVRVENIDNGKSVVVRINDRGPFAKNRIIDLSKKAATEINMLGPGTAKVRLYLLRGDLADAQHSNLKTPTYTVQLGSFVDQERALKRANEIKGARVEKIYLNGGNAVYRVYFGTFTEKSKAESERDKLSSQGYSGYVKQIEN